MKQPEPLLRYRQLEMSPARGRVEDVHRQRPTALPGYFVFVHAGIVDRDAIGVFGRKSEAVVFNHPVPQTLAKHQYRVGLVPVQQLPESPMSTLPHRRARRQSRSGKKVLYVIGKGERVPHVRPVRLCRREGHQLGQVLEKGTRARPQGARRDHFTGERRSILVRLPVMRLTQNVDRVNRRCGDVSRPITVPSTYPRIEVQVAGAHGRRELKSNQPRRSSADVAPGRMTRVVTGRAGVAADCTGTVLVAGATVAAVTGAGVARRA